MCLAEILCMAGFATYPALLPELSQRWGLSSGEAGFVGGVLFLGYVAVVPILTSLTDRMDARRVYLGSALLAASGSAFFAAVVDGFWGALVAQALFGIGFGGVYMPGLKAMSDRLEPARQSRATALYTSLSGLGLAFSYAAAGFVADAAGWRGAFALAAAGPVIAGVLVFTALKPLPPAGDASRPGLLAGLRLVFANRAALGYIVGYAAHCWELYAFRAWLVAFLAMSAAATGLSGADATTIAGILALGGIVSSIGTNEVARKVQRPRLICVVMITTAVLGLAAGEAWRVSFPVVVVAVALYYAAIMADSGALTAGTVAAAPPAQRGATLAVHSTFGFAAGLVAPTTFGLVLDLAGGRDSPEAWPYAFLVLVAPGLLAAVFVSRLAGTDQAAIEVSSASSLR